MRNYDYNLYKFHNNRLGAQIVSSSFKNYILFADFKGFSTWKSSSQDL